jgi:large subunit ribosomal protein L13
MQKGRTLGRLLRALRMFCLVKHKPTFTPGVEMGDFVVVVNAENVTVTGTKTQSKLESKIYYSHSGYPGGLKSISLRDQLNTYPDRALRDAVWGMLAAQPHGTCCSSA